MESNKAAVRDFWNAAACGEALYLPDSAKEGPGTKAGQRHRGPLLSIARVLWPHWLFRRLFRRIGLFMLITARKPA